MEAAIALARYQRDVDNEEARSRAREADRWREVAEERARELQARCHSLEQ